MVRTSLLLALCLGFYGLVPACSGRGGDDDDDDLVIDRGDGGADGDSDADSDGDGDGAGTCADACANVAEICPSGDESFCLEACNRYAEFSDGACLDAFGDYNGCVANATTCTDEEGITGCDREASTADTACTNGCVDIVTCVNGCAADDQACGEACVNDGDQEGLRALQALLNCWRAACGEAPEDPNDPVFNECLETNCEDEYSQCR